MSKILLTDEFRATLDELAAHRVLDWDEKLDGEVHVEMLTITLADAHDAYWAVRPETRQVWLLLRGAVDRREVCLCQ